jgi:hypothetical protein
MSRHRAQDGALSVEFIALLPITLFIVLAAMQVLTVVAAGTSAAGAARDGSRAHGVPGQSCPQAVRDSLPDWLRDGHRHTCDAGETVEVEVRVPNMFPGLSWPTVQLTRAATLPNTSGAA